MTDRDGKTLNVPESGFDHILDASRYALVSIEPVTNEVSLPEQDLGEWY
jgi:hypothetical protein